MRILIFIHGHPAFIRGGAEQATLELFEALRARPDVEPILVARTGDPAFARPGSPFGLVDGTEDQFLLYSEWTAEDYFLGTAGDKQLYTKHIAGLVNELRPDVVHFQHAYRIGYEAIRVVRNILPEAPIVYTLHEYLPICHANGQMVRTGSFELCTHASPQRCHQCFPEIAPGRFLVRERFVKAQFELVDRFIAPSRFLLQRFAEWGIPAGKLTELDYGRHGIEPAPVRQLAPGEKRSNFGFFGQLNPYKGVEELLHAMLLLDEWGRKDIRLHLSGANLESQPRPFRKRLTKLIRRSPDSVRFLGSYEPRHLARRMAAVDWVVVPSIWWENSPLVIQEAYMHGRPVLASDIGGMAERVDNGISGLHFTAGDPDAIARAMIDAADGEGLWDRLRAGIPELLSSDAAAERHVDIYRELKSAAGPKLTIAAGTVN